MHNGKNTITGLFHIKLDYGELHVDRNDVYEKLMNEKKSESVVVNKRYPCIILQ